MMKTFFSLLAPGMHVLDVGAGDGNESREAITKGFLVMQADKE